MYCLCSEEDVIMNNISNTYNYNDLASLNAISNVGREDQAEALKQVAHQFESMFISMMLKSMRDANEVFEEDNPLNSNESKFYRQMFDDQLALSLSQGEGIGLADSIYRQLKDQFDVKDGNTDKPNKSVPIREFNGVNPFSSLKPKLDLPQFQSEQKAYELDDGHQVKPLQSHHTGMSLESQAITQSVTETSQSALKDTAPQTHVLPEVKQTQTSKKDEAPLGPITKQSGFQTPQEFVDTLWPVAQKVGENMGVEPKAIMAQAALETGWGKFIIHQADGNNSHNLFGIKADHRWDGSVARVSTLEYRDGIAQKEVAPFRVYDSYEHSLKDYAQFVKDSERYQKAIENGSSIKGYSEGLQQGGYATDPNYAKKIQRIAHGDVLAQAIERTGRG